MRRGMVTSPYEGCSIVRIIAMRTRFSVGVVVAWLGGSALLAAVPQPEKVTLDALLVRSAWYLDYFIDQFENVVAEEDYVQDSSFFMPTISPFGGGGRGGGIANPPPSASDTARARHRDLRSDFLLVKSPETEALIPFRDVIAVDGVSIRDREERLAKLFINATGDAMSRAERIREEGARYNLGNMRSTIGNPVMGLGVLQRAYQPRFRFALGKEDRAVGAGVWTVDYKEDAPPAMIRGEGGNDLFSHGRVWVEASTGRVMKTELQVEQPSVRAVVTTTFRVDPRFDIAVPMEMREVYTLGNGNRVTTVASYGRFRRFDVTADEEIHTPRPTFADDVTGMTFVELTAGRFTMGSAASEIGRNDDEVLHDVEITHPFLLAQHEVTQQDWRAVMASAPSRFADCGPKCPVENVTFRDVEQYLAKLNERPTATLRYRLPTEAEWEYACRAGTTGPFSTGDNLTTSQANYNGRQPYASFPAGEFRQRPTAVATFPLNPWGLADMHGNVWEWTSDWYGPYVEGASANIDPKGPASGEKRVIRGGSWFFDANSARCGLRYTHDPKDKGFSLGFRLAADRRAR
jgi:formylglycine-generating enzyme required for sulfatase activity